MEPLSTEELSALREWMADKGLSQRAVAESLDIGSHNNIALWLKGGGIRPAAKAKLMTAIAPYLKPDDHFVDSDKMVPAEIRPSLAKLYGRLCEIEDGSPAVLEVVKIQVDALAQQWPKQKKVDYLTPYERIEQAVVKESLTTPALTLRPKTTPPELRIVRPLDDLPMLEAAAGTGRESAAFAMNAGKAQVIGESMEPEYQHGEIVKLEPLAEVVMMNDEGFIDFAAVAKVIKSGGDYLLSLNDSGNTIKRIRLEPPGPSGRWALNLVALNRDWADTNGYDKGERMIRRGDSLVIYARVRK